MTYIVRESTKSESPELRLSLEEVRAHEQEGAPVEQANECVHEVQPEISPSAAAIEETNGNLHAMPSNAIPLVFASAFKPKSIKQLVDEFVSTNNGAERPRAGPLELKPQTRSNRKQPCVDTTSGESLKRGDDDDLGDPIESDSDTFLPKQQMHSGKQPRLNCPNPGRFDSDRVPLNIGKDRSQGESFETSNPPAWHNRVHASLGEPTVSKLSSTGIDDNDNLNAQQIEADSPRDTLSEQHREEGSTATLALDKMQLSLLTATALSQESKNTAENPSGGVQEQRLAELASLEQKPDAETRSHTNDVYANDAEKQAKAGKTENVVEAEKNRQAKATEDEIARSKRVQEKRVKEKQIADEKRTAERQAEERQAREKALSEQAARMMLAADGARDLETEKLEKRKSNVASDLYTAKNSGSKPTEKPPTEAKPISAVFAKRKLERAIPVGGPAKAATPGLSLSNETDLVEANAKGVTSAEVAPENTTPMKAKDQEAIQLNVESRETSPSSQKQVKGTTPAVPGKKKWNGRTDEEKARRKELDIQRRADRAKAAKEKNAIEEARAYRRAQKVAKVNAMEIEQEAEKSSRDDKVEGEEKALKQKSTLMLDRAVQKSRETSDDESCQSSTPTDSSISARQNRKTMTPAIPRFSINESSSKQSRMTSSSPLAVKSAKNLQTPLRRALKQGCSALRRSVSFLDDSEAPAGYKNRIQSSPSDSRPNAGKSRPIKHLVDSDKEPLSTTPAPSTSSQSARKFSGEKGVENPAIKKEMLQMKLNVTRDVKGKGRAIDPPKLTNKTITEISSSDGDDDMSCLDPLFRGIKVENDRTITPALPPPSNSQSQSASKSNSASQSPAQVMRKMTTLSSNSALRAAPGSGSRNDSIVEADCSSSEDDGSPSEGGSSSDNDELNHGVNGSKPATIEGSRQAVKVLVMSPKATPDAQPSPGSIAKEKDSQNAALTKDLIKSIDQAANKQMQGELHQCAPVVTTQIAVPGKVSSEEKPALPDHPKLDRHGRLPNGTRPAYYRYPKLSELKRMAEAESTYDVPTSQTTAPVNMDDGEDTSSSSEDDDSKSNDEESGNGSQASSKSDSGRIPGMRSLMKRMSPLNPQNNA